MTMQLLSTNRDGRDTLPIAPAIFSLLRTGPNALRFKTRQHWVGVKSTGNVLQNFDSYVGMELSLVPEVESVFVRSDNESGKGYTVLTVVNERDPAVRAKVYAREQAIMDAALGIDFSFRVVSRMNRNLQDMIDPIGTLVYQR